VDGLGERASPVVVEEVIQQLCAWHELTAAELAVILGRNQKYIQITFLIPMADAGKLVRKFPETKNHPQQAYRTASTEVAG
jgi:ATP-dependent DNA helicase RecG